MLSNEPGMGNSYQSLGSGQWTCTTEILLECLTPLWNIRAILMVTLSVFPYIKTTIHVIIWQY